MQRRHLLAAAAALAATALTARASARPEIEVWKTPTCGCCKDWIAHMEANGFKVFVNTGGTSPAERAAKPRVTSNGSDPYVRVAAGTQGEEIRRIYDQLSQEHGKLGTRPNMTFEQLTDMITKQSEVVRTRYNVSAVGFRVETVDGKVKLKAKPIQE